MQESFSGNCLNPFGITSSTGRKLRSYMQSFTATNQEKWRTSVPVGADCLSLQLPARRILVQRKEILLSEDTHTKTCKSQL